jgi:cell shape-determining protein MreC
MGELGLLEMRYVSGMEKVQAGDAVMTTGQDAIYPPGYRLVMWLKCGRDLRHRLVIHIRPSAGLERLKEVAVLRYQPPPRVEPVNLSQCRKRILSSECGEQQRKTSRLPAVTCAHFLDCSTAH